jgi:inosine/xanthosine triphosphate pyrophosphatase family protein
MSLETTLDNNEFVEHCLQKSNSRNAKFVLAVSLTPANDVLTFTSAIEPKHLKEILQQFVNKL